MFSKVTTNLIVPSVNDTLDFYEQVLGVKLVLGVTENTQQVVTTRDGGTPLGFAIMQRDDVEIMFQSQESVSQELPAFQCASVGRSFSLYTQVADVRALYENIRRKVTILKDLHRTFYGTEEFRICDCNGYVLTFAGSPKETAS